ncbi:nickel transport protein [Solimonas aquatica]|uniref:Nickel transport protein n=1 Tax=Solimonas aquatica TaxID=489703 RepID=A0A1H9KXH3_9GAMM|nr:DUF4198 domain-containing protein [Solimonas aquatica]SER03635.1 nickel transport protein [Solimonas aquatica]
MNYTHSLSLLAALLLIGNIAQAHDAWVAPGGTTHAILYGHGKSTESYDAAKIQQVLAYDAAGRKLDARLDRSAATPAVSAAGAAMFIVDFDNGFWSKTEAGYQNLPKTQVQGALESSRSLKFGKTVLSWSAASSKPVGQRLEIVPLATTAPKAGGRLPVLVLFEGRPLAEAKLSLEGHDEVPPAGTDAKGRAELILPAGGEVALDVSHKLPYKGAEADEWSLSANLHFLLP